MLINKQKLLLCFAFHEINVINNSINLYAAPILKAK